MLKKSLGLSLSAIIVAVAFLCARPTYAAQVSFVVTASIQTRLQQYDSLNGTPILWYSTNGSSAWPGTACQQVYPADADAKRFFQVVHAAKLTGTSYFIYVETTTCRVTSFGLDAP